MQSKLRNTTDNSKLFLYSKLKSHIQMEEYLLFENSFKNRQTLTKFRVSDHTLKIEQGRYLNIPREQRLCSECQTVDDEKHFFLDCKINKHLRDILFNHINTIYDNFKDYSSEEKLHFILKYNNDILSKICDFMKQSLELRKVHIG